MDDNLVSIIILVVTLAVAIVAGLIAFVIIFRGNHKKCEYKVNSHVVSVRVNPLSIKLFIDNELVEKRPIFWEKNEKCFFNQKVGEDVVKAVVFIKDRIGSVFSYGIQMYLNDELVKRA